MPPTTPAAARRAPAAGNFICDVWRAACRCDAIIVNGGTFRSDTVHPAGPLTHKDLTSILPMASRACWAPAAAAAVACSSCARRPTRPWRSSRCRRCRRRALQIDDTIVIEVTGAQLLAALENGVSQYPKHEGRFPQARARAAQG